jgi:hypothetical protein
MSHFQKLVENSGYQSRSYQGRGMNHPCLGIDLQRVTVGRFLYDVLEQIKHDDQMLDDLDALQNAIENFQLDQLGKGIIIYFPSVEHEEDDPEEEGESEN